MSKFDIVLYGATGFTGRLVARYLSQRQCHFAIAGRSLKKLQTVHSEEALGEQVGILQADSDDAASLQAMVAQAKGVITTVGPYAKYGSTLYSVCAKAGVVYVDLTGEPIWMAEMLHKHVDDIRASGSIMISSSGFDSVPSDLATLLAVEALQEQMSASDQVGPVVAAVKFKGGMSGGTFASALEQAEMPPEVLRKVAGNLYVLSPVGGPIRQRTRFVTPLDKGYGAIFPLSMHNRRIVMRSWGLRKLLEGQDGWKPWGDSFVYSESLEVSNRIKAFLTSATFALFNLLLSMTWSRALLQHYGPKPGDGPKEEDLPKGFFRMVANVSSTDGKVKASGSFVGRGDPGYGLTAVMLAEAALSALDQQEALSKIARRVGALTPSFLGRPYLERLAKTGLFTYTSAQEYSVEPPRPQQQLKAKL